jgi:hypothetical protein
MKAVMVMMRPGRTVLCACIRGLLGHCGHKSTKVMKAAGWHGLDLLLYATELPQRGIVVPHRNGPGKNSSESEGRRMKPEPYQNRIEIVICALPERRPGLLPNCKNWLNSTINQFLIISLNLLSIIYCFILIFISK